MPTNTAIPTLATGNVLTAAEWNDLTVLNTSGGLFDTVGGFVGSVPPTTAPNFLFQPGYTAPTFTGGFGGITFGTAFPNGLLTVIMTPYVGGASTTADLMLTSSTSKTGIGIYCTTGGSGSATTAYTGSGIGVAFLAIGY